MSDGGLGSAALLPDGPWQLVEEREARPAGVRAVEYGALALGMGALFSVGYGLGARGDVWFVPLVIALLAIAAVFLVPDALQHRIERAAALVHARQRARTPYSEERLLSTWPARTDDEETTSGTERVA